MATVSSSEAQQAVSGAIPDGEIRKKQGRRNRTMQSCMNCHSTKRMCDRQRPACTRCIQLGLTGLCIYEVDDPRHQNKHDDKLRLMQRVAELEAVIREAKLKNLPGPRWMSKPANKEDKTKSRSSFGAEANAASIVSSSMVAQRAPSNTPSSTSSHTLSHEPSEFSTPWSTIMPTAEYIFLDTAGNYELASFFNNFTISEQAPPHGPATPTDKHPNGHCGCLRDSLSYYAVLELSMKLRRAAGVLRHSARHQGSSGCLLTCLVDELDAFIQNSLDSIVPPLLPQEQPSPYGIQPVSPSAGTQLSTAWDISTSKSNHIPQGEDPFMSWEPPSHT